MASARIDPATLARQHKWHRRAEMALLQLYSRVSGSPLPLNTVRMRSPQTGQHNLPGTFSSTHPRVNWYMALANGGFGLFYWDIVILKKMIRWCRNGTITFTMTPSQVHPASELMRDMIPDTKEVKIEFERPEARKTPKLRLVYKGGAGVAQPSSEKKMTSQ